MGVVLIEPLADWAGNVCCICALGAYSSGKDVVVKQEQRVPVFAFS